MRGRILVAVVAALAATGCGSAVYDPSGIEHQMRSYMSGHGLPVRSISCPKNVQIHKGVVSYCTAALTDGNAVSFRVTQVNAHGLARWTQADIPAEQLQNGIRALLSRRGVTADVSCPNHVPVVVGKRVVCLATAGSHRARIGARIDSPSHVSFRVLKVLS
jgi:hypothetical protein